MEYLWKSLSTVLLAIFVDRDFYDHYALSQGILLYKASIIWFCISLENYLRVLLKNSCISCIQASVAQIIVIALSSACVGRC